MKAKSLDELIAAQKKVPLTMTDKSGNVWEIEVSPLCARIVDEMDRLYPAPIREQEKDENGKGLTNEDGSPKLVMNEQVQGALIRAWVGRNKVALAAAIGPEWFGPSRSTLEQQIAALEDLFGYAEINRAAQVARGEVTVTPAEAEEAAKDIDPFAATSAAPEAGR